MLKTAISAALSMVTLAVAPSGPASPIRRESPATIEAVQAYLFYNGNGTFSPNIIGNPGFNLWNVIIGEGSAAGASNATLVAVGVHGRPTENLQAARVRLVARTQGGVLLDRSISVGVLNDQGVYIAAFWLYDTGCLPVQLTATLTGAGRASTVVRQIPFACGE